jgi:Flp pilus assembly protein TadD
MFYEQAGRCYAIAEELSPRDWRWLYYRALTESERGNGEAAAVGLRRLAALEPHFAVAWWRLGEAEFKNGRDDLAEQAWHRAMSLPEPAATNPPAGSPAHVTTAPISAYAALGLARVALLRGNADHARQILESITSSAPRFGAAFRLLAEAYTALGRAADDRQAARTAARLPAYTPYADPMVDVLARESRSSAFLLRQAAEADPTVSSAWGEYLLRRAVTFDPDNADAVYELGTWLDAAGRSSEAFEFLRRYQQMVPDDYGGLAAMGGCLVKLGRLAEAETVLRRALENLDHPDIHYNLGIALTGLGRSKEGIAAYQGAIARDPTHPRASNNLATAFIRDGRLKDATHLLRKLLEMDPKNAQTHTNLGVVFMQLGDRGRARREFHDALRLDPQQSQAREALQEIGDQ